MSQLVRNVWQVLAQASGASKVGFQLSGSGAVLRSVYAKLAGWIDITDFGADPTGVADSAPAVRLALAAAPYGGTLWVPAGHFLLNSAVNGAIFDFTPFPNKGITIRGVGWSLKTGGSFSFGAGTGPQGSIFEIGSAITTTTDFYHQAPTDLVIGGTRFFDFAIVAHGGAYGAPYGRHGLYFDGTAATNGYFEQPQIDNVFIDNFATGYSIYSNGSGNAQGVMAGADFRNSKFMCLYAPGWGDSNTVEKCIIGANATADARNLGIYWWNVPGATSTRILNNDLVNFSGMIVCDGGTKPIVDGNECEQSTGSTNGLGAMIYMRGAASAVEAPTLTNNAVAQNSAVGTYTPMLLSACQNAKVGSNRMATLTSYAHVSISANSEFTVVDAGNDSIVNGVLQSAALVGDAGVESMLVGQSWKAFTPTITAGSGAFTSVSAAGRYELVGKKLTLSADVTINTLGTAAGAMQITLPAGLTAAGAAAFNGKEIASTGKGMAGHITTGSPTLVFNAADGASLLAAGDRYVFGGSIEVQ